LARRITQAVISTTVIPFVQGREAILPYERDFSGAPV
jgi:hypothetical protein